MDAVVVDGVDVLVGVAVVDTGAAAGVADVAVGAAVVADGAAVVVGGSRRSDALIGWSSSLSRVVSSLQS